MRHRGRKSAAELATIAPTRAEPQRDPAAPPDHFSDATKAWWIEIITTHRIERHQLRALTAAAEAWDLKEQAREILAKRGLTYEDDRGMIRARPEAAIMRDNRIGYLRAMRELGLDKAEPPDRNSTIGLSWRQLEEMRR
jgi:phage terminase small subunit